MVTKDSGVGLRNWRAESLRVTLFAQAGVELPASDWWLAVVGEPPESKTERLRESLQTMEGHLGKAKLILNVLASRVDWISDLISTLTKSLPRVRMSGHTLMCLSLLAARFFRG